MPEGTRASHQRCVLVVDDDRPFLDALGKALRKIYRVLLALDAPSATEVLHREAVDLIILDVLLGEESGLDFLDRVRETNDVPVLLISAYGDKEMVIAGLRARASDYLDKPFTIADLLGRVQALIGQGPRPEHIAARIRRFIQQHYMRCWTVESLAKELRLTVRTMRRMFSREYRQSVLDYLEEVRITRACELLASTDLPIQNVAAEVGYRDPDYFGRVFRQRHGRCPREFRVEHRESFPSPLRPAA